MLFTDQTELFPQNLPQLLQQYTTDSLNRQVCSNWSRLWCRNGFACLRSQLNSRCLDFLTGPMFNLLLRLWNFTGASFGIQAAVQMNWWHTVPLLHCRLKPSVPPVSVLHCCCLHCVQQRTCAARLLFVVLNTRVSLRVCTSVTSFNSQKLHLTAPSHCMTWDYKTVRIMGRQGGDAQGHSPLYAVTITPEDSPNLQPFC